MDYITRELAENHLFNGYADFISPPRSSHSHTIEVRYHDGRPSRYFTATPPCVRHKGGRPPLHPFTRQLKQAGISLKEAAALLGVSATHLRNVARAPTPDQWKLVHRAIALKNGTAPPAENISCLD